MRLDTRARAALARPWACASLPELTLQLARLLVPRSPGPLRPWACASLPELSWGSRLGLVPTVVGMQYLYLLGSLFAALEQVVALQARAAGAGACCDDVSEDVCVAFADAVVHIDAFELEGLLRRRESASPSSCIKSLYHTVSRLAPGSPPLGRFGSKECRRDGAH